MNPIINELIKDLEANRNDVVNKSHVLSRLRESQKDFYTDTDEFPIMPPKSVRQMEAIIVRGGV